MTDTTARCTCGAVHLVATGAPLRVGICHCRDCQRHHGAPFFAAAIFPRAAVTINGTTCDHAGRHSCEVCGASVFAISGDEVDVHLGALDDPTRFTPTYELWTSRRLPWLAPFDGMTQYPTDRTTDTSASAITQTCG